MAGYIIVDVKTRKIVGIAALVTLFFFVLGIIIGFFSGKGSVGDKGSGSRNQALSDALTGTCPMDDYSGEGKKYVSSYLYEASEGVCIHDNEDCLSYGLPRHYIAYHLRDKTINIDGKLDDEAWAEVPWTEDFVDIRETATWLLPVPRLPTRAKIRWDDTRLYVGAYIEETDLWGVITEDEKPIYQDNDFEVLLDVDGSLMNYKQMQINVRNASWDLMYYRSPYDHKDPNSSHHTSDWTAGIQKNVYYDGTINNPTDRDKYWSVEWSFTFEALAKESQRMQPAPSADEVWFLNFGRAEWNLTVTPDNHYQKVALHWGHSSNTWWSWNPCGSVNLLLQNRWGLVQFKRNTHDKTFLFKRWPVYKALFDVFDALKAYQGKHGNFIDQLEELNVPPYLFTRRCVEIPTISVDNGAQFNVTVKSRILTDVVGHIRQDRYVALHWGHSSNTWWSWNPCGSVNLLLQNRWGLVQFKRNTHDKTFLFKRWPVYKALFDVFDALKAYQGKHGNFIDQLEELNVPPYLFTRRCVEIPTISVDNGAQFNVTVKSRILTDVVGHIRQDRYVSFDT